MDQFIIVATYGQLRIHEINLQAIVAGAVGGEYARLIRSRATIELTQIIIELNNVRDRQIMLIEQGSEKELSRIAAANKQLRSAASKSLSAEVRPQINAAISQVMLLAQKVPLALDAHERAAIANLNMHINPLVEKCTKFLHVFERLKL